MSKETLLIVLGGLNALLSVGVVGIPGSWIAFLTLCIGIAVGVVGFMLRGQSLARGMHRTPHHPFVESMGGHGHEHEHRDGISSLN